MRSSTKPKKWHYLILCLAMIGLIKQGVEAPFSILFPLFIAGFVYYLYRFPPRWLLKLSAPSHPIAPANKRRNPSCKKRRKRAFRVIDGNK
jgi:hypothetical protein